MINDQCSKPVFVQVAERIENLILDDTYLEGDRVPSQFEIAQQLSVNPLTVGKGMQLLEDYGIVSKKRGKGMFVLPDAKSKIYQFRRTAGLNNTLDDLIDEADTLQLADDEVLRLYIERRDAQLGRKKSHNR